MMVNDVLLLFFDDFLGLRLAAPGSQICSPSPFLGGGSRSGDPLLELAEAVEPLGFGQQKPFFFQGKIHGPWDTRPGKVKTCCEVERSSIFHGKISTISMVVNSTLLWKITIFDGNKSTINGHFQ